MPKFRRVSSFGFVLDGDVPACLLLEVSFVGRSYHGGIDCEYSLRGAFLVF